MTVNNKDDIKIVSCLDNKDTRFIYLTVRMTIDLDIDQDNEMKDLKSVTTIEKKGPHSDSDD